jgi:sirohydrochlorin cobaltochelatase
MSKTRPVIVLVGFGASSAEARNVYAHIEARVREAQRGCEVRWAFTSGRIAAKLREQGVKLPTLTETIDDLEHRGVRSAVFQPLLTVPGQEYAKLAQVVGNRRGWRLGAPLLDSAASLEEAIDALAPSLRAGAVNVLACHGNRRYPEYNRCLLELARAMESRYANVVVASVEGSPGLAPLERARALAAATGAAHFIPFMIVSGEHVVRDVMGDGEESWRRLVGAASVSCAPPLGWSPGVVDLYLRRLEAAIAAGEKECQ